MPIQTPLKLFKEKEQKVEDIINQIMLAMGPLTKEIQSFFGKQKKILLKSIMLNLMVLMKKPLKLEKDKRIRQNLILTLFFRYSTQIKIW